MNFLKVHIVVFIFFLIIQGCQTTPCHHEYIPISNTSTSTIYFIVGKGYPDTNDYKKRVNPVGVNEWKVNPGSTNLYISAEKLLECPSYLVDAGNSKKKFMVWIFDSTTLASNPWDSVAKYNLYLKRYDLNYDSIDKRGWKIVFP